MALNSYARMYRPDQTTHSHPNPPLPEHQSHFADTQEDELIQLYLEMCSHDDTIDRKEAAQCIARRLHRARRLNVSTERGGNDSGSVVDHSELNLKPQG
jgi:hypothetical protein